MEPDSCFSTLSRVERPKTHRRGDVLRQKLRFSTLSRVERPKTGFGGTAVGARDAVSVPSLGSNGRKLVLSLTMPQ